MYLFSGDISWSIKDAQSWCLQLTLKRFIKNKQKHIYVFWETAIKYGKMLIGETVDSVSEHWNFPVTFKKLNISLEELKFF